MFHRTVKSPLLVSLLTLLIVPIWCFAGSDGRPELMGKTDVQTILSGYSAFMEEYQRFEPSISDVQHMSVLTGKSLLVMFGSWCHDSEREVPRLIKLLEKSQVELSGITWLAVDRDKREDSGLAKQYNLKYTPTIIIMNGNDEIGRIIERPNVSLAQDFAGLASK